MILCQDSNTTIYSNIYTNKLHYNYLTDPCMYIYVSLTCVCLTNAFFYFQIFEFVHKYHHLYFMKVRFRAFPAVDFWAWGCVAKGESRRVGESLIEIVTGSSLRPSYHDIGTYIIYQFLQVFSFKRAVGHGASYLHYHQYRRCELQWFKYNALPVKICCSTKLIIHTWVYI